MGVARPWRAIAFECDPTGQEHGRARVVAGRAAAASRSGLAAFLERHPAPSYAVDVWEVLDMLDPLAPDQHRPPPASADEPLAG